MMLLGNNELRFTKEFARFFLYRKSSKSNGSFYSCLILFLAQKINNIC